MITVSEVIKFKKSGRIAAEIYRDQARKISQLERVCYHESGHYVQIIGLGYPVVSIEVDPRDCSGLVKTSNKPDDANRVLMSDDDSIGAVMAIAPEKPDLAAIEKEVRGYLQDNWLKVQRIAHALYTLAIGGGKVTLTGGQVERLFWTPAQWADRYGAKINE
jgi:hypothetical protein